MKLVYPACFYQDPATKAYTVEVPDLPGCVTGGETLADAILMAEDAASGWVLDELEDGRPAPAASAMADVTPDDGGFVSLLTLDMDAYGAQKPHHSCLAEHLCGAEAHQLFPSAHRRADGAVSEELLTVGISRPAPA